MSDHKRKRQARVRRSLLLAVPVCLLVVCVVFLGRQAISSAGLPSFVPEPTAAPTAVPTPTPEPTPLVQTVTFSASGDNLIHAPIYRQAAARATGDERYDFSYCYANLADFYSGYDVNWINQETLVNDELEPSTYPCFSTPGECADALYDVGIRVFTTSNNHIYDKGATGIAATRRFWASMPEDVITAGLWAGEEDYDRIPIQTVNGVTIAYLAYTESTNGLPTPKNAEAHIIYTSQTDLIEQQVRLARQKADFVVVGVHWGVEYSHTYNQAQQTLAQQMADWGADVVIGTHPHVLQDAQWLTAEDGRSVFVAYSLGNFISTQDEPDRLVGAILSFTLQKTTQPDGAVTTELLDPALHPVVTHYGPSRSDCCAYLLKDYTADLAAKHGIRAKYGSFGYEKLVSVVSNTISPEYLASDWKAA